MKQLLLFDIEEDKDHIIFLQDEKNSFRCNCGCNVFRKISENPLKYKCNWCQTVYNAEK